MTKLHYTGWIIAGILGVCLAISHCSEPSTKIAYYPGEKEYIYDSVVHSYYYNSKDTIKEDSLIYVPVPAEVDTQEILKDYFAKRIYTRSHRDSIIDLTITDTISQNKIGGWGLSYKIIKPTTINTYKAAPKQVLLIGIELSQGVGINAGYLSKSNFMLDAAYYPKNVVAPIRVGVRYGFRF